MARQKITPPTPPGWDVTCPLSPGDCDKLTKLIQSCADTACILDALESLGLEVTQIRAENESQKVFAEKSKAFFFPNVP
jgi:hypothetical protein